MKRSSWILLLAIAFLVSCGKKVDENQQAALAVKVVRGPNNQPSISIAGKAASSLDADLMLFEEEGYVTAQDRFFQMDILRRVSQGRLSELTGGQKAFDKDTQTIGLGILDAVENSTQKVQFKFPEIYRFYEAYAKGVNRFVSAIATEKPELLRQYRVITKDPNYLPPLWEPKDSVSVMTSLTFYLSSGFKDKLAWGMIAKILTLVGRGSEFAEMLDLRPIENDIIVDKANQFKASGKRAEVKTVPGSRSAKLKAPKSPTRLSKKEIDQRIQAVKALHYDCSEDGYPIPECGRKSGFGSNNWAVSSSFAGGGASFIANDPHLPLTFPMTFYEVALDSKAAGGTIHARGVMPPGLPGILIGHNEDLAWALTNLGADVDDIYVEVLDPTYTKYRVGKKLKDLKIVQRVVMFRNERGEVEEHPIQVKYTEEHGPIFTDHIPQLRDILKKVEENGFMGKQLGLSYKWIGHPGTSEVGAIAGLNRAKTIPEFKASLNFIEAGAQNVIFADKAGNIGYYAHGLFPIRNYVRDEQYPPHMYVEQVTGKKREWESTYREVVPEISRNEGFIVTANNDPFGHSLSPGLAKYEDYFGFGFSDGIRAHRIAELLREKKAQKGVLTAEDMQAIQLDVKDLLAIRFIEALEKSNVKDQLSERGKVFLEQMVAWKAAGGIAARDRYEPVAFYEWLDVLEKNFYEYREKADESVITKRLRSWAIKQDTQDLIVREWDNIMKFVYITSPALKTLYHKITGSLALQKGPEYDEALNLVRRSIEVALDNLQTKGKEKLKWGQVNRLVFANALEGILPQSFSLGLERGGSWETVNVAGPGYGPNFRLVMTIQPNKPIEARISVPGGNYNAFDVENIVKELKNWRDGAQRDLVSF
jgi:penicillin amidase